MRSTFFPALFCSILSSMQTFAGSSPEIIAHRGASFDAPENTLAAVLLGWKETHACEIDIHLSRDGYIVAIHDLSTQRTTGHRGEIASLTLAEIQKLDAGSWKAASWKNEKIPALKEILSALPAGKKLVIEIKSDSCIVPVLAQTLKDAGVAHDRLTLIAFDYETIRLAKKTFPDIPALWIVSYKIDPVTKNYPDSDDLIQQAKAAHLEGLNLSRAFPIDSAFVQKIKKAGLKLYVWTVDDPAQAAQLAAAGVDAITTNRPGHIRTSLLK